MLQLPVKTEARAEQMVSVLPSIFAMLQAGPATLRPSKPSHWAIVTAEAARVYSNLGVLVLVAKSG